MTTSTLPLLSAASSRSLRELYAELGAALLAQGRSAEALRALDQAAREDGDRPSPADVQLLTALALEDDGRPSAALTACLRLLSTSPEHKDVVIPRLGRLLQRTRLHVDGHLLHDSAWADVLADGGVPAAVRAELARLLGQALLHLGKAQEAAGLFERAAELATDDYQSMAGLGTALRAADRLPEAAAAWSQAEQRARRSGDDRDALLAAVEEAETLLLAGRVQEALGALPPVPDALRDQPEAAARALVVVAAAHLANGDPAAALQAAVEARQHAPTSAAAVAAEVHALLVLHRNAEALVAADSVGLATGHPDLVFRRLQAMVEGQLELDRALDQLRRHAERVGARAIRDRLADPAWAARAEDGRAAFCRAHLLRLVEDPKGALEEVERAVQLGLGEGLPAPADAPLLDLRADLREATGDVAGSVADRFQAGQGFLDRGDVERAVALLDRALQDDPAHPEAPWLLAEALRLWAASLPAVLPAGSDRAHAGPGESNDLLALLRRAAEVWDQAASRAAPTEGSAWALLTRALIDRQLLRVRAAPREQLLWSAVVLVERGLVLTRWHPMMWSVLAELYLDADLNGCAREVCQAGLQFYPDDLGLLEGEVRALTNTGDDEAALRRLADRENLVAEADLDPPTRRLNEDWHRIVRVRNLLSAGRYAEARDLAEAVRGMDQDRPAWFDLTYAEALRMSGDRPGSEEVLRAALARWAATDPDVQEGRAWALFGLGQVDEAWQALRELAEDGNDPVTQPHLGLLLCTILRGDLEAGADAVAAALDRVEDVGALLGFEYLLRVVRDHTAEFLADELVDRSVGRIEELARRRREVLGAHPDAEDELAAVLRRVDVGTPACIAAWAASARRSSLAERWVEAAEWYQRLLESGPRFPEAGRGLAEASDGMAVEARRLLDGGAVEEAVAALCTARSSARQAALPGDVLVRMGMDFGDALLTAGHAADALQHYRDALADLEGRLTAITAELYTRMSLAHALLADLRSAQRALFDAVRAYQEVDEHMPGLRIAEVCEPLITDVRVYWTLDEVWAEVERSAASDASSPLNLTELLSTARRSLVRALDRLFGLGDGPTASEGSVRSIILELGSGLVAEDTSDRWVLFSEYIPQLRSSIQSGTGVWVPGILVRGSGGDLEEDGYRVLLNGIPVARGHVVLDRQFSPEAAALVERGELPAAAVTGPPGSLHGFAGGWLTPADGERLADAGHEVWRDPLQFAVRHMDVVIRRNLPAIMTFEQTSSMLADWRAGADADLARLVTALVPGIPDQVRLHRLLRALAADRVPVSDAAAILAALSGTGWPDASLEVLTRTVRRALRPSLPGNEPGTRHVALPASILAELAENGAPGGELRSSAGTLRSVLQLRELLSSTRTGAGVALVVPDEATRRAVRRLTVLDFPDLAVISRDELVDAGSGVAADLASSGGQR